MKAISLPMEQIAAFCRRWRIREMALFGSVLRDDFGPDSDVDFMVTYHDDAKPGWPAVLDMEEQLAAVVGRRVEVAERYRVEAGENYIRRRHILNTAETIYVEG